MAINRFSQSTAQSAFPKFTNFWDGTTATSAFDSLGTVVLSSTASSVTFSSIPATYTHLQMRLMARISRSGESNDFFTIQYNGDTGANYTWHALESSGAAVYAESGGATSSPRYGDVTATTATAGLFGVGVVDILDYANTNKYKTLRTFTGRDQNGSGWVWVGSGAWLNTSAITSVLFKPTFGTDFQAGSTFALYGVK